MHTLSSHRADRYRAASWGQPFALPACSILSRKPLTGYLGRHRACVVRCAAAQPSLTPPLRIYVEERISAIESNPAPRWPTFVSHVSGDWVGQSAAFTPWEGKTEPVWLDERGNYCTNVLCRSIETRETLTLTLTSDLALALDSTADSAASPTDSALAPTSPSTSDSPTTHSSPDTAPRSALDAATGPAAGPAADPAASPAASPWGGPAAGPAADPAAGPAVDAARQMDVLVRRLGRTVSMDSLVGMHIPAEVMDEEGGKAAGLDVELLGGNADGCVIFNGGSYSSGPEYIGSLQPLEEVVDEEEEEEPQASNFSRSSGRGGRSPRDDGDDGDEGANDGFLDAATWVVEGCLFDGGQRRMRLRLTCKSCLPPGAELELEPMRLLLFQEHWSGPVGVLPVRPKLHSILDTPLPDQPRASAQTFTGRFKVFTEAARPVQDIDYDTGEDLMVWTYSSREEVQTWQLVADDEPQEDDGAALWLPGGVVVTITMAAVPTGSTPEPMAGQSMSTSAQRSTSSNGAGNGASNGSANGASHRVWREPEPRGVVISLAWAVDKNSVLLMERFYDAEGELCCVQHSTALRMKEPPGSSN